MWTLAAVRTLIGAVVVGCAASAASAQELGRQGDRFTVNGVARFLVFVSYFDGVRRVPLDAPSDTTVLDRDLDYFVSRGIAGIRVWANTPQSAAETLMQCDGTLRDAELRRLRVLIGRAAAKGLVVDLTFTRENVRRGQEPCLTVPAYAAALAVAAESLADLKTVLFDVQNEWNVRPAEGTRLFSETDVGSLIDAVRAADPSRLVTASTSGHGEARAARVAKGSARAGTGERRQDVLAYHDPREPGWESATGGVVRRLRAALQTDPPVRMPIYLQEPSRCGFSDCVTAHYVTAVRQAKRAGAAAWTFHSDPARHLNGPASFASLLRATEHAFLDQLRMALDREAWGEGERHGTDDRSARLPARLAGRASRKAPACHDDARAPQWLRVTARPRAPDRYPPGCHRSLRSRCTGESCPA